jgi:two-component system, response regulator
MIKTTTILLVEDNPDDEEFTLKALHRRRLANQIVVARDGQEALDYLFGTGEHVGRDTRVQPEIILLDINLPKVNGIDVLKRIRADARTMMLPVVILTTSVEDRDLCAAYMNHVNSYIRKPMDFDQFADAIDQLGLYWMVLNQGPPRSEKSGS